MAFPQVSARQRPRGVVHVRARHTDRFTVVGNHLAQHGELTLTAIGLGVHIQSLPEGAQVDIRSLTARFPEGETRIASALRELEEHGYLSRTRERLPTGRMVTRTVSYDHPAGVRRPRTRAAVPCPVRPHPSASSDGIPCTPPPGPARDPAPDSAPDRVPPDPAPDPDLDPRVPPDPASGPTPDPAPDRVAPDRVPPPLPVPRTDDPERHRTAAAFLAGLRAYDERLLLSGPDVHRLSPAVAAWLERGVSPEAVRRALTTELPDPVRHPAALLAHRLTALLPPPLPATPPPAALPPPLQNCDGCDRAFRSPNPGRCRACSTAPSRGHTGGAGPGRAGPGAVGPGGAGTGGAGPGLRAGLPAVHRPYRARALNQRQ